MDQPAALGWRARDVRRLWSGCDLWLVVVVAVVAAWIGLVVACIEVWINGVFVSIGGERRCRFLFLFASYLPLPYFMPHGSSLLIFNRQSSH